MNADFIEQWKRDASAAIKEYARVNQYAYRELPTRLKSVSFMCLCQVSWLSFIPRAKATWDFPLASVKVGTYRALSYITYPANSQSPAGGALILLQRVS